MIYIIDFDNVLFDRSGKFAQAAEKVGIVFKGELYEKSKIDGIYNPFKHLGLLGKSKTDLIKILKQSKNFLFPETVKKLKQLRQKAKKLILLSKGNPWFHKQKIKYSGLTKYFDEIYITNNKLKIFQRKIMPQYHQEKIVFIDDKKEELEEVKKAYPSLETRDSIF